MNGDIGPAFVAGLVSVFTWPTLGFLLVGIAIGFLVGILPGLGGGVALALMLPFTFGLEPVEAFAFLLGMLSVTATTGDITSILFGVPGESISAALVMDGHALAKRGEAGRALGAALMSSLLGAVFGAFVLAASIPFVRPLVLSIGTPEFFMLSLLGIAFVSALSGRSLLTGLIAAGAGLMLSTVGVDLQSGIQRYTFGRLDLWDGIGLVPVTVGLFAIPEIVELAVGRTSIAGTHVKGLGGALEGVYDTFRHGWLTLRCSALGAFTGLIPGLGGAVGQWIAYAHAVQSSPDKERFGHGAIEGVIGPGAANNSKEGGNLITALAFGVPTSVSVAILIGAFQIQGLVPGPAMLTRHLDLVMSFVWLIAISNIIAVGVAFLFIRQLVRVTLVRASVIVPVVILFVLVGTFAEKNALFDIGVMLLFGIVGLAMERLDWPRPPLILGLVLGRLAENNLFLATARYDADWLFFPSVMLIGAIALVVLVLPVFLDRAPRERRLDAPN